MTTTRDSGAPAIVLLQGSVGFGGSKQSLLAMVDALRQSRFRPIVVCPGRGWLTDQLAAREVACEWLPFYAWRKWLERPRVAPSLRRHWLPRLRARKVRVVHSNEFWWAPHAALLARHLGARAVGHLRDGHHTLQKARQYRLARLDRVLAVSTELREQFASDPELYGKTTVFYNGHGVRAFPGSSAEARASLGIPPAAVTIANVGRLCERKNQKLLLPAAAALQARRPRTEIKFIFAGDYDSTYYQHMRAEAARLNLSEDLHFLGRVEDIERVYAACDLVAHCAQREGLPRVIPEAMLAGRAVVSVAAEGVRDAIPDDRFGLVVPHQDAAALAEGMVSLITLPARKNAIQENARARAQELFSFGANAKRLIKLYDALLKDS